MCYLDTCNLEGQGQLYCAGPSGIKLRSQLAVLSDHGTGRSNTIAILQLIQNKARMLKTCKDWKLTKLLLLNHETKRLIANRRDLKVKKLKNCTYFTISFHNVSNEERKQLLKGKSSF